MLSSIPFDNSYARLPGSFFVRQRPTPVARPSLIRANAGLAALLGIDAAALETPDGVAVLAGNQVTQGSDPLTQAYAGHQFGGFVPRLGDGRAILLGEIVGRDGIRRDLQLKGAGPTAFSRNGDGRAALGPVLREYIVSEAMAALGIPTTRALAAVLSGEDVWRETPVPGAILCRVAQSHVRVGTFQYFAARDDRAGLAALADYVTARHAPECAEECADAPDRYAQLLTAVLDRQAKLIARWMGIGFIHGVMNTDNMTVSGETIDYGPCAFMDGFDPGQVYSSIDRNGRYAYGNQPSIAQWNIARLAEAMLPLLADDQDHAIEAANTIVRGFSRTFEREMLAILRAKLGLSALRGTDETDGALANGFLKLMASATSDFTNTWRGLTRAARGATHQSDLEAHLPDASLREPWVVAWRARLAAEAVPPEVIVQRMAAANPWIVPRNHRVEAAIAAAYAGDFAPFHRLVDALATPYTPRAADEDLTRPPAAHEVVARTFCGT